MRLRFRHGVVRGLTLATALALPLAFTPPASAAAVDVPEVLANAIAHKVKGKNVHKHLEQFQAIATANGGNRAAGTPGYDASLAYVQDKLRKAGYRTSTTDVEFPISWEEFSPSVLQQVSPEAKTYANPADFVTVHSSSAGDVTAQIQVVDPVIPPAPTPNTSTAGCEDSDFAGFVPGRIALIQRGTCPFVDKATNAKEAGAAGVIFFNEGQPGRTDPLEFDIVEWRFGFPIVMASTAVGLDLADSPNTTVRLKVDAKTTVGQTRNLIADSRWGRSGEIVMSGAHLDSVPEGPGINDNGSGTAAVLETALKMAYVPTKYKLRFAFWGAEELGLLGSEQYVAGLSQAEKDKIRLYLNFDMVASPNDATFLYDGDDSDAEGAGPGPAGSAEIEKRLEKFYAKRGLPFEGTDFDGRSDYGPFIANGIPSGGIFTGAEDIKTAEQAAKFGGTAGVAFDPCYHAACDGIANISAAALERNSKAVAYSSAYFAFDLSNIPDRNAAALAKSSAAAPARHSHGDEAK
ncbi:M28 family peptidase [Planomonospora venezuelensis]|uniref:Aminopeptidase Y n=1 Tax=Planomonospora venezuelensis TaxID=1999 RepID=A0A841CVH7_PLAVE|nr:M28 family peptidase [Planomonospora venezuelensis]MBB5961350.1 aminopeptidase Y [Planomonospora venezuelensis]GIN01908.1 aminopeptidase [Planomonospora venezuelensis]